jgi:phage terminase small subunit
MLTPRRKRFVEEYLIDLNNTQAAIRAGYSKRTANEQGARLLANASVREAIANLQASRSKRTEISADYVLTSLKKIADRCMRESQAIDKDGNPGDFRFDANGANRSLELLGKHLKLFVDRQEHSGPDGGDIPIAVTGQLNLQGLRDAIERATQRD